jgi:hypothetical protein
MAKFIHSKTTIAEVKAMPQTMLQQRMELFQD